MEEEVGIKVTRLRRRLSVESDDVKSPSTPTKKRGGRLAAKPQLELIDENAPEAAPKRSTKSSVKEVAEPVEEKAVTPARRSTRARSNTSIVSETPGDVAEDKGTPSRRSTRIKSNTSLIAEPVNLNSPRAKRAAKRLSQVGSDTEAPITPARQTRRTRNNSTSSIDKPVEPTGKLVSEIKEVIEEESENVKETKTIDRSKNESPSLRNSPRLIRKSGGKSSTLDNDNKENEPKSDKEASETAASSDKSVSEPKSEQAAEVKDEKASEQVNLSATSKNLIQELEEAPKKAKNIFNKSATAIEEPQIKTKRNRTKSWTTISVESPHESSFCSDSEASEKRNKKKNDTLNFSNISGSGDGFMKVSSKNEEANKELENVSLNSSTLSNKKKKKKHEMSMSADTETSVHKVSMPSKLVNKSIFQVSEVVKDKDKEENSLNVSKKHDSNHSQLFGLDPNRVVHSIVYIDDSDSNHETVEKDNDGKSVDSGDQCVPVVNHQLVQDETSENPQSNLSYEPMDIDETMPDNVSLSSFDKKEPASENRKSMVNITEGNIDTINKSKRKSSISNLTSEDVIDQGSNKSPRKSSISEMINNEVGDNNKSKRKSSISNVASEDTTDGIFNVSNHKSLVIDMDNCDESMNKKSNKSKRKSSISNVIEQITDKDSNNSLRKSLNTDKSNDQCLNEESNKSKRKSSISNIVPDENTNEISNKSARKSSVPDLASDENLDNSLNNSKRNSSVTAKVVEVSMDKIKTSVLDDNDDDEMVNKSSNKSKRKSSIINMPKNDSMEKNSDKSINKSAPHLDNSDNDNKSTLVLSQLKDISENEVNPESNVAKDNNESNEQLSKSVTVPNVATDKDTDKKNLSLTYSTSTPLQQKAMKKLGLQINSSIIAPNSASKIGKLVETNKSQKGSSIMTEEDGSESSEDAENNSEDVEEDSEEESSFKKSKLVDDEAEEASDDYESGDSRDEDEREYEKQNEIKEKGETLDSDEEELSDDSDYEKDSFIVSSDEEDNGLLSGSGDDLSMSADELTMTAKSKKKFNERKIKEQKKASREMYEARHKLNNSDKSTKSPNSKSKNNNRQRFDTSSSESEEEVVAQPKKNRRQRIDSSHDTSALKSDADETLSKKKRKKAKRLSESECDENEKEITICDDNQTETVDPLTLNVIKQEPKTPQKELNISTVAVTNMDEVEEVNVDENVTIMKANQTSDPLQATIAENDEDNTDEGSISENEEITQNYESVLLNLNKSGSKKIKSSNISLDLDKKAKQKSKEPIVDQLNLTQVKQIKKKKSATEVATDNTKLDKSLNNKSLEKVNKDVLSEGSSDSIDMKLLFPEDSNDSEAVTDNKNQSVKETTQTENDEEAPENFIPLKKSQGKTNIFENMDNIANKSKDESILNGSGKKKNKRKSSQTEEGLAMSTPDDDDNLGFFIDTTGTHTSYNKVDANTSVKSSAKKNKQKNNVSFVNIEEITVDDASNDAPLEVSYRSEKNKSKQDLNITQENEETQEASAAVTTPNESAKKKKKNKKGLNSSQNVADISVIETKDEVPEKSFNTSVTNVEGSAKKKKKRLSESQIAQETGSETPAEPIVNVSIGSAKKQKQKSTTESTAVENENINTENEDVINPELVAKKRKRKSSANQTIDEIIIKDDVKLTKVESIPTKNQKKKRKISNNDEDIKTQVEDLVTDTQEQEKSPVENTKKKSKTLNLKVDETGEVATKKNKKRKERDDDDASEISKVLKQNSFDKIHIPRLPANVIKQLDDKPKKDVAEEKKTKVISTSEFIVQETKRRRTKPSNYLEESVYCVNDDTDEKKQKRSVKIPKVLPFIPTATTSDSGFTTKFRVNVISHQTKFVAQSSDVSNFKNDYLHKKRIKKLGTFEMYKRQRNIKIAKF